MPQQKSNRPQRGVAGWTMLLSWLFSFLLVVLAALLMLMTTLCHAGYMKSRVSASQYGDKAHSAMREEFISYGAATGFSEETMTAVLDPVQIEQDLKDAVDGLYADAPYRYDRPAVAEAAYAAMQAEAESRGITLEGQTAASVQVVAEAVRQVYASYTAVPLLGQLFALIGKVRSILLVLLPISRHDAMLGARGLVFSFGGAGLVSLVIGLAVGPILGLQRLNLEPLPLKDWIVSYVNGMFGRFLLFAAVYLILAAALALLLRPRRRRSAPHQA